jgi:hypothetical protein
VTHVRRAVGGRGLTSGTRVRVFAGCRGPHLWSRPKINSTNFLYSNRFLTDLNLNRPIGGLIKLKKFHIKYGFEVFEIRENFPYRNFSRFKKDFELKFEEASMV